MICNSSSQENMSESIFDIVTIGASAGGIEALKNLLSQLPRDFPVPIALVVHRSPRPQDILALVLNRSSNLPVQLASDGELMKAGVVYVAPADFHLTITAPNTLSFRNGSSIRHTRSAIDPLFTSAAEVYGRKLIAVVLTGGGTNGVRGVVAVNETGGTVIVQDPKDAAQPSMPSAAVNAGAAKYVLPLAQIPEALVALLRTGEYTHDDAGEGALGDHEGAHP
jgi:two-component system chemotaxis response regulator CheB